MSSAPNNPTEDDDDDDRIPMRRESLSRRHLRRSADAFSMRNKPLVILLFASASLLLGVWLSRYHQVFDEWAPEAEKTDSESKPRRATIVIEDDIPTRSKNVDGDTARD